MERRRGAALVVDAAGIEVESPSEEALTTYLAANAKTYEAPEYRSVSLLVLAPEDLVPEIEVSDADLRAAYDARIELYRTPGQRRFEQLLASDEATIQRAAEMVAAGQGFIGGRGVAEGRRRRAHGARPAGEGRPAGKPRSDRLGTRRRRRQRAGADSVRLASGPPDRDRARADAAVRDGQGRDRARGRARACNQPAARLRHAARRRAGRRHDPRRRS